MNTNKNITLFNGLNSLRFFAALFVIISHVELIKMIFGYSNHFPSFDRINFGGFGVYFFFVLSGFLITYLLLKEKDKSKTISLGKFYLRRILRIWPLYYLIVILGFFVLPNIHVIDLPYYKYAFERNFNGNLILYLTILPNLAFAFYSAVPHIGQSWSIGVEEQFYIFWPILIKKFKNTFKLILWSFIIICLIKATFFILAMLNPEINWIGYLKKYLAMCKFESMMIGSLGAYILFENKSQLLRFIYHPITFFSSLLLFFPLNYLLFNNIIQNAIHIPISFMFLIIILNIAANDKCKIKLNNKILDYLGQISYGIYMYHLMIIPIVIYFFGRYFTFSGNETGLNIGIYLSSVLLTIGIASLSYHYFEKPFLKIKKKYEIK